MSGSAGVRGYLLQTIACLLESLDPTSLWDEVSIEPTNTSEKVDILWRRPEHAKVTQVKSSQNQIAKPDVESWAEQLEASFAADEYELQLLGPCSQAVATIGYVGKVKIPVPRVLDVSALVEQAAHRLDRYLEGKGISKVPPFARELIVNGLIAKLEAYSTTGSLISRSDLDRILGEWILVLYPTSISNAVAMQCDILVDTVVFPVVTAPSHDSLPLVLPIVFVNGGIRTAVVEWVAAKIVAKDHIKLYSPVAVVDLTRFIQGRRALHAENTSAQFSEFPVLPGQAFSLSILLAQEENDTRYPFRPWSPERHVVEIYVKYRDRDVAIRQKEIELEVTSDMLQQYKLGTSISNSIRKIDI